jgi:hypothetical protein
MLCRLLFRRLVGCAACFVCAVSCRCLCFVLGWRVSRVVLGFDRACCGLGVGLVGTGCVAGLDSAASKRLAWIAVRVWTGSASVSGQRLETLVVPLPPRLAG